MSCARCLLRSSQRLRSRATTSEGCANNHLENQIRPWAMGRKAWLFCGSELAGQRAAIVVSLLQSAKLNGHDPHAYLRDVRERLPSHPASRIGDLLPHRWQRN